MFSFTFIFLMNKRQKWNKIVIVYLSMIPCFTSKVYQDKKGPVEFLAYIYVQTFLHGVGTRIQHSWCSLLNVLSTSNLYLLSTYTYILNNPNLRSQKHLLCIVKSH